MQSRGEMRRRVDDDVDDVDDDDADDGTEMLAQRCRSMMNDE